MRADGHMTPCSEYKDDSAIIPRASSVIVKRIFAKPGKGKAALYLAGASSSAGPSDSKAGPAGGQGQTNWHRGNITKRFDGKEEPPKEPAKSIPVTVCFHSHTVMAILSYTPSQLVYFVICFVEDSIIISPLITTLIKYIP